MNGQLCHHKNRATSGGCNYIHFNQLVICNCETSHPPTLETFDEEGSAINGFGKPLIMIMSTQLAWNHLPPHPQITLWYMCCFPKLAWLYSFPIIPTTCNYLVDQWLIISPPNPCIKFPPMFKYMFGTRSFKLPTYSKSSPKIFS